MPTNGSLDTMGVSMGWFSSAKTVDDVMDKDNGLLAQVGGWIGNMKLTPEEVMKANAVTVDSVQKFAISTMSENTERSKTRRRIAVMWMEMQIFSIVICFPVAAFDMELAKFYFELATSPLMLTVTTAISIFFFGSQGLARLKGK